MKKLITILCATLISVGVFAQAETEAGTFLISMGTDGVNYSSKSVSSIEGLGIDISSGTPENLEFDDVYDKFGMSEFGLKTAVGYFVADGFMIGLGLAYESTTTNKEYTTLAKDNGAEEDRKSVV